MSTTATPKMDTADHVDSDRKNAKQLVCERCQSKVLPPRTGTYEELDFELNVMKKKSADASDEDKERLGQFYRVDDMFDFDNVGFSNTVEGVKYLICADCEIGPIGFQRVGEQKCYVALARAAAVAKE